MESQLRQLVAVAVATCLFVPTIAVAAPDEAPPGEPLAGGSTDEDPQEARAMEAYERGTLLYNQAKYAEALLAFEDAASLYASPDFQYNIGLCYQNLDKLAEAIRAFETYLRNKPDAPDRANVEARIDRLRERLANDAPAEPVTEPQPTQPTSAPTDQGKGKGRGMVIAGSVLTGVGAALAIGGGVGFGLVASARSDELDDVNGGNPDDKTVADARDIDDRGNQAELLQLVTAGVGAAVAITGVALLAVGLRRRKASRTAAAPMLAPGMAGLAIRGQF